MKSHLPQIRALAKKLAAETERKDRNSTDVVKKMKELIVTLEGYEGESQCVEQARDILDTLESRR